MNWYKQIQINNDQLQVNKNLMQVVQSLIERIEKLENTAALPVNPSDEQYNNDKTEEPKK